MDVGLVIYASPTLSCDLQALDAFEPDLRRDGTWEGLLIALKAAARRAHCSETIRWGVKTYVKTFITIFYGGHRGSNRFPSSQGWTKIELLQCVRESRAQWTGNGQACGPMSAKWLNAQEPQV